MGVSDFTYLVCGRRRLFLALRRDGVAAVHVIGRLRGGGGGGDDARLSLVHSACRGCQSLPVVVRRSIRLTHFTSINQSIIHRLIEMSKCHTRSAAYVRRQRGTARCDYRSTSLPAGPTAANLHQRVCCCGPVLGQADGADKRTDTVPFHRLRSACDAGSATKVGYLFSASVHR